MIAECLEQMLQDRRTWLQAQELSAAELVLAVLAIALIVAALAAPVLAWLYRRRVTRLMNLRQLRPPPPAWWQRRARHGGVTAAADVPLSAAALEQAMQGRLTRIRRATLLTYGVVVAGTGLALPLHEFQSLGDSAGKLVAVAALAAGPAFVNATLRLSHWWLVAGAALLMGVSGLLEPRSEPGNAADIAAGLLFVVCFAAVAVHRTWRALFVPLTVLALAFMTGLFVARWLVEPGLCGVADAARPGSAVATLQFALVVLPLAGFVWLGTRAVGLLTRGFDSGLFSDISVAAAFGVLVFAALLCFTGDRPGVTALHMLLAWAVWMALALGAYVLALRRMPLPRGSRCLLVLRVFSHDRRAERLLDTVQTRWRYGGAVLQIGGPDLAALNIDPPEFARFIGGTVHELFLPGETSAEQLAGGLDFAPDREGRYRINEVFCFDSAWRATVERLMGLADTILLDVRGFSAERHGTAFELGLLRRLQCLDRVVMVGDTRTDWPCVDSLVGSAAGGIRLDGRRADLPDACLQALCRAATGAPPGRP